MIQCLLEKRAQRFRSTGIRFPLLFSKKEKLISNKKTKEMPLEIMTKKFLQINKI